MALTLTDEDRLYLAEGLRHRARYYGRTAAMMSEEDALTLALASWREHWRDLADRGEVRNADMVSGDLFKEAGPTA